MERNWVICRDIDRPRDGHTEWGQEKSKYVNAYMWNLEKWYRWIYSQVRNRDADLENECTDTTRGMGWGGMNWEDSADICTPPLLLLKSLQLCLTLCDRVDCSPQGFSVHAFSRQEYWSGYTPLHTEYCVYENTGGVPCSRGSSWSRDRTQVSCITGSFFTAEWPGKPHIYTTMSKIDS